MSNSKLKNSAVNLGATATRRAKKDAPQQPDTITETNDPVDGYSGDHEDEHKANRRMVSAYIDRQLWDDVCQLARYRAAKGIKNHLGQPLSAGRLLEDALRAYIDNHRDELNKWRSFLEDENQ